MKHKCGGLCTALVAFIILYLVESCVGQNTENAEIKLISSLSSNNLYFIVWPSVDDPTHQVVGRFSPSDNQTITFRTISSPGKKSTFYFHPIKIHIQILVLNTLSSNGQKKNSTLSSSITHLFRPSEFDFLFDSTQYKQRRNIQLSTW